MSGVWARANAVRRRLARPLNDAAAALVMVLLIADVIVIAALLQSLRGH